MQTRTRLPAAVAATILASCGDALAQQTRMAVPEVSVTAPAPAPAIRRFSPFTESTRVEEDKWPEIPCGTSRISFGAGGKCQNGNPTETFLTVSSESGRYRRCDIAHQLTIFQSGPLAVEADALIFDPYKVTAVGHQDKDCTVWSGFLNLPEDFKDLNQVTRRGDSWRNFTHNDAQSQMEFSNGGRGCVAVERLGPPWHGGYVWVVHASICRTDARLVQAADIESVLGGLQLRSYDPAGNLAKAPH
jgi:hypothetical protein